MPSSNIRTKTYDDKWLIMIFSFTSDYCSLWLLLSVSCCCIPSDPRSKWLNMMHLLPMGLHGGKLFWVWLSPHGPAISCQSLYCVPKAHPWCCVWLSALLCWTDSHQFIPFIYEDEYLIYGKIDLLNNNCFILFFKTVSFFNCSSTTISIFLHSCL